MARHSPLLRENRARVAQVLSNIHRASGCTGDEIVNLLSKKLDRSEAALRSRWYRWRSGDELPGLATFQSVLAAGEELGWLGGLSDQERQFVSAVLIAAVNRRRALAGDYVATDAVAIGQAARLLTEVIHRRTKGLTTGKDDRMRVLREVVAEVHRQL